MSDDYETGYKKPPKSTRFQSGQSGNPKGRPKGAKGKRMVPSASSLLGMVLSEAYREIKLNEGGEAITMPAVRAVFRSNLFAALKGKVPAQKLYLGWTAQAEKEHMQAYQEAADLVLEYRDYWKKELHRLAEAGEELPELPVDPDCIYIDPKTRVVRILDPENCERDKFILLFEDWRDTRKRTRVSISRIEDEIDDADEDTDVERLQRDLQRHQGIIANVGKVLTKEKEVLG